MSNEAVTRVPFTPIDEAVYGLNTASEPWTIQLEIRMAGSLDDERLRKALRVALDHHAMARARAAPETEGARHLWEITPSPDLDPLHVVRPAGVRPLGVERGDFYSEPVPLRESPPFRARLLHHPDGDALMMAVSHAAFDGFGALRLLHSIARAYSGRPDPPPPVPLADARDLDAVVGDDASQRQARVRRLADKARDLLSPPAHLAPETGDGDGDAAGYGFHQLALPADRTRTLVDHEGPGTVNDVLLAALNLAIDGWNHDHGVGPRRISVLVPVNLRPAPWREDVVTNMVVDARVATVADDRVNPRSVLEAVSAESERIKGGGATALARALVVVPKMPPAVKDRLDHLLGVTGDRVVDTAVLSNLGSISDPPSFGSDAGDTTEMWFSAPTRMPCGLSVGAVSMSGRLHLTFRYRRALWHAESAARFARGYLSCLGRVLGEHWEATTAPVADDELDRLIASRVDERVGAALAAYEKRNDPLLRPLLHGDESRLHVHPTAVVNNALFNLSSGDITVEADAIFGHGVSVLTGTHDVNVFGAARKTAIPRQGRDVVIRSGAWVASNATILGPATIGENAVVGAGALVQGDVKAYTVVAGVPAKEIKRLDPPPGESADP